MSFFDEEPVKKRRVHEIGQDLSLLSVGELEDRIAQLREEIGRLEQDLEGKSRTRNAAEALFRRS